MTAINATPRQRWGTCCPYDPECEHSFMDDRELSRWMDRPITEALARQVEGLPGPCSSCDHDPACGYASVTMQGETYWLCHEDDHSCYVPGSGSNREAQP